MRYSIAKTMALLILGFVSLAGSAGASFAAEDVLASDSVFESADESSMSVTEMDVNRGTFGINALTSEQALAAETTGNALIVGGNMTNGTIAIGDNVGGFGSYVMNTGNNSTINSAVAVNVQLAPSAP
ncbi:MAG: hypothetical protein PHY92_05825 [Alphaproteobacteria bacterium]|nr:hypothetical protein [Alphaproteobacteria bacterium]